MSENEKPRIKQSVVMYDAIRQSLGFHVDDAGGWVTPTETPDPITINKKQLITPTREVLSKSKWDKYQPFHPISENRFRKKSIVLSKLQVFVVSRITNVMTCLIMKLVEVASDKDCHDQLSAEQRAFLPMFAKLDKDTIKQFSKVLMKVMNSSPGQHELVGIACRRGSGKDDDKFHARTIVSFPIMSEEKNGTKKVFDVTLTVRDREMLFSVLRHILPKIDTPEEYGYGTLMSVAPLFHSLMMAFYNVASDLNKVTNLIGEYDSKFKEENHIVTSWYDAMVELSSLKDEIPPLEGNEGEVRDDDLRKAMRQKMAKEAKQSSPVRPKENNALLRNMEPPRRDYRRDYHGQHQGNSLLQGVDSRRESNPLLRGMEANSDRRIAARYDDDYRRSDDYLPRDRSPLDRYDIQPKSSSILHRYKVK